MYSPKSCPKHTFNPCPRRCWQKGRTLLSYFRGDLVHARTYESMDDALCMKNFHQLQNERYTQEYHDRKVEVPQQFSEWDYMVWDGQLS